MVKKIISGGQSGADIAALRATRKIQKHGFKIETGGHCPAGYRTEKGSSLELKDFGLICTKSKEYPPRTRKNVAVADGTVIFGRKSGGTKLTINICKELEKPYLFLGFPTTQLTHFRIIEVINFIEINKIDILNVAGSRESKNKGIEQHVEGILFNTLDYLLRKKLKV